MECKATSFPSLPEQVRRENLFDWHHEKNILVEPDLSCIRFLSQPQVENGSGFVVFMGNFPEGKRVVKVERTILRENAQTGTWDVHYPWIALGLGQDRSEFHTLHDAGQRRRMHLDTKKKLESVGIETANYVGSMIIPARPAISAKKRINTRHIPLYAEVWEHPGGVSFGYDQKLVRMLYESPQGRVHLKELADKIICLSEQGYLFDIDHSGKVLKTQEGNFPFPRGFFVAHGENLTDTRFVAVDFNRGIDFTKQLWWSDEFLSMKPFVGEDADGIYGPNEALCKAIEQAIDLHYRHSEVDYTILLRQLERFKGQLTVAASMREKIGEMEKIG